MVNANKAAKKGPRKVAKKVAKKAAAAGGPPGPPGTKRGFLVVTKDGQFAVSTATGQGKTLTPGQAKSLEGLIKSRKAHGRKLANKLNSLGFDLTDAYIVDHKP